MCSRLIEYTGLIAAVFLLGVSEVDSEPSATVTIHADEPGAMVSSNLFGVFYEEINYAGEGGLYGEMVRNRAFYDASRPNFWRLVTQGDAKGGMNVDTANPLNANVHNSLKLTLSSGTGAVGAGNSGFWGMSFISNHVYNLSFFAKSSTGTGNRLEARLESDDGSQVYGRVTLSGLTGQWQRFTASIVSSGTETNGRLVLAISEPGSVWLSVVSLFPADTYHDRPNGLRPDLAEKIAALHPSFLRFPGGNYIEGYNVANALRWKTTIGDVAERKGHLNDAWGYWSTDGLGAYEFFQFCEDLGMEPLYGINAGLMLNYTGSAFDTVPLNRLQPWVQDALDLLEYANGGTNTSWGARRAADGHPAPFNLKYLEIGNENGGRLYDERYTRFYDAIKAKYPYVHLIAPGNWTGGRPWTRPIEIADEHYYDSPSTFRSYATKYDSYNRSGPKIFVGEYAVTSGYGTYGNLSAALGEAAFMTGIERNSDIVKMASYAPLLANVNGVQWHPDLIYYNNSTSFGTPSYYVQKMFSENRGDVILPTTVDIPAALENAIHGAIGLGSWNTSVEYADLTVKSGDKILYRDDFSGDKAAQWHVSNGRWRAVNGRFKQADDSMTNCRATTGDTNWANYSITVRARKLGGNEGFLILFNWLDDNDWTWLNIGGWNNTLTAIEQDNGNGKFTLGTPIPQSIQPNVWYDIRIDLSGRRIRCYLNDRLVQDVSYPSDVFVSSTYARAGDEVIIKAVNARTTPTRTDIKIAGLETVAPEASVVQLTSSDPADENSFSEPTHVFPVTNTIADAGKDFTVTLPANSLSVFRLKAGGGSSFTNLVFRAPSAIKKGQTVSTVLWGHKARVPDRFDLTANEHHAIAFSSKNPDIASVDSSGKVTGLSSGIAEIVATYDSLGLSATQTVRVSSLSAKLVHRYSFGESSGTVCVDSVGGAAWNGRLPAGGTISGGKLVLSAAESQYMQLPPGILSNYPAVTIDAWVTFSRQLPQNCFFFGFGDVNDGTGNSYIFCAPQAGRIAITDGNYSQEQNANGYSDFSFKSKVHLTAVFNPPQSYIAFYTNGVLAAINHDITIPLTSVKDIYNYVGRSLYAVDPYADIDLDEFRIYNGALTADEIANAEILGPDRLPTATRVLTQR